MNGRTNHITITSIKDRIITKDVERFGDPGVCPYESYECTIAISDIKFENENGPCAVDEHSRYFNPNFDGKIVIGEADSFVDFDLEKCILKMCLGEISSLNMRYTNHDSTKYKGITCKVHLVDVTPKYLLPDLTWEELFSRAAVLKERGVELVKLDRVADAFRKFGKACKYMIAVDKDDIPDHKMCEFLNLKIKIMNNVAFCQLYFHEYEATVVLCTNILNLESDNDKALFRRAMAYMALGNLEEGHEDMAKVVEANPQDVKARQNLAILKEKMKVMNNSYKNVIKKMFSR